MDGWFETFLDKILIVFFAIFGGAARFAIAPPVVRSMWGCVGSLIIAGFAGILTWQLLEGLGFSTQTVAAGVGIAGLLGDDLLKAILKLGVKLREDPLRFVDRFLRSRAGVLLTTPDSDEDSDGKRAKRIMKRDTQNKAADLEENEEDCDELDETDEEGILRQYEIKEGELEQRNWELVDVYNDGITKAVKTSAPKRPRKLKRQPVSSSPTPSSTQDEGGQDT